MRFSLRGKWSCWSAVTNGKHPYRRVLLQEKGCFFSGIAVGLKKSWTPGIKIFCIAAVLWRNLQNLLPALRFLTIVAIFSFLVSTLVSNVIGQKTILKCVVVIDRDSMLEFETKVCQVLVFIAWPQINNVIQYCMLKNKVAFCYESRYSTWSLILNSCKIRATLSELRLVLAETNWYSLSNFLIGMMSLYWAKTNHKCSFDGHNFVTIADW